METITIRNDFLTVKISLRGAEMTSIRDQDGIERLWHGDPAFWGKHAPILFPMPGALKEDAYLLEGSPYRLAKHGFARERMFSLESHTGDAATFLLAGEAAKDPGFPFAYAFQAHYTLEGKAVRVEYITENLDGRPLWYGVGAHEAYACPEGIDAYEIRFEHQEPLAHNVLNGSLLTGETHLIQEGTDTLSLTQSLFANDSLVFTAHRSRSATLQSRIHSRKVRVDFQDFQTLLIWTPKNAPFVCIEPWTNPPDTMDTDQDITKKPGMIRLNPGEISTLTHVISF